MTTGELTAIQLTPNTFTVGKVVQLIRKDIYDDESRVEIEFNKIQFRVAGIDGPAIGWSNNTHIVYGYSLPAELDWIDDGVAGYTTEYALAKLSDEEIARLTT